MTAEASTRAELIRRIEATYPPDSDDPERGRIGNVIMLELLKLSDEFEVPKRTTLFADRLAWAEVYDPAADERLRLNWREMMPFEVLAAMATAMESEDAVREFARAGGSFTSALLD